WKVPLDDSVPAVQLVTGQEFPGAIAVLADELYWTNDVNNGSVMQLPLSGGPPAPLATGTKTNGLAIAATAVDFTERTPNVLVPCVPIGGGSVTPILLDESWPWAVAVDSTNLYWLDNTANGGVYSVPKPGGVTVPLATAKFSYGLAVDANDVFFSHN